MLCANHWKEYELIDASDGEKLERWGNVFLLRPDPQILWHHGNLKERYQDKIDAIYHRSAKGGGYWENKRDIASSWAIHYQDLTFQIKQMGFKHTGLFPEQAVNWEYMIDKIKQSNRPIKVLNLFAYTGGASVACLRAGASVTHVDSSKGMVDWCKENVKASGLTDCSIRYLVDDVVKFVKREIRRGNHYDAIIMDPPSYGRGTAKEVWNITTDLKDLIILCNELLSSQPLFFLINSYTTNFSPTILENLLTTIVLPHHQGSIQCGEIGIPITANDLVLPCGIYGRWESEEA